MCGHLIYYPPGAVYDRYRGIYRTGYVFLYTSVPPYHELVSASAKFFINISETMSPTNMYYISLPRSFYRSPAYYCLFVFTEVRLITAAAAGLWSPLNNFLAFQIFLSFLSFFKTIGAGKFFGILCADLKLNLR